MSPPTRQRGSVAADFQPEPVTLAVMARAPVPGRCKTRLGRVFGAEAAAELYGAMLLDTLSRLEQVPVIRRVIAAAPEHDGVRRLRALAPAGWEVLEQRGDGLGARLSGVTSDLWTSGNAVVLVDSDSPTIPLAPLRRGFAWLCRPNRALIGPSEDGGYYLLGLSSLELGVFDDISWSTPLVLAQTRGSCAALGLAIEELPVWYDVDTPGDVERLARELGLHPERAPRSARVLSTISSRELQAGHDGRR
jgi:uncharacterized protein